MRVGAALQPALALVCGLAAGGALAQAGGAVQRVEITAGEDSDTDKRRREPVAKAIYGREELDRYGDVSVSDVLKRLPGVSLQGGNPRLRGLGAGYTLILVNGEPAPPGFSLDNLSPSMVERIEVTKGPTAETSAQAVAGTINVVLRQAARQRQRELRLSTGHNAGPPKPSVNLVLSDRFDALSATLPVAASSWRGGTDVINRQHTLDGFGQAQERDATSHDRWWGRSVNLGPRLNWKLDDALALDWQSYLQRSEYRAAGELQTVVRGGTPPPSVDDGNSTRGHWQVARSSLQLTRRAADGGRFEARVGGQATGSASSTQTLGNDGAGQRTLERLSTSANRDRSLTSSGKFSQALGDGHTVALGWDLESRRRREQRSVLENGLPQLQDFEDEPFEVAIRRSALYVQDEWELSARWSAYGGLRGERIATESVGRMDATAVHSQVITPLLHVNFKPRPAGRDLVRASLTRSYRAPEPASLIGRPILNAAYPAAGGNTELAPDRVGNPALRPELATGLDLAWEQYLSGGGVLSAGLFHRRISGLTRNRVGVQAVSWSPVPRWVSMPVNLSQARSTGVELEAKGKASELLGWTGPDAKDWALRSSVAVYRSRVKDVPGPDNRLEGQQPWALTLGADRQRPGDPLSFGASVAVAPGYDFRQSESQTLQQGRTRTLDAYVAWAFDRDAVARVSVSNLWPLRVTSATVVQDGEQRSDNQRRNRAWFNASLTLRF